MSNKLIRQETVVSDETGEVRRKTDVFAIEKEPPYVKVYLDCLLSVRDLSKSLSPILLQLLNNMTYASPKNREGGQIISITKFIKEGVAEECGISISRVDQAVREFTQKGIFKRIARATYQVNPDYFGKGDWKDIRTLKANFDFNTLEVKADIVTGEDEDDENQNRPELIRQSA